MRFTQWLCARLKPRRAAETWGGRLRPLLGNRRRRSLFAALVATLVGLMAWAAVGFADNAGGCDFSPANNGTPQCLGALSGSNFAGGDGNLQTSPANFGTTDWQNVAGLNPDFDLA